MRPSLGCRVRAPTVEQRHSAQKGLPVTRCVQSKMGPWVGSSPRAKPRARSASGLGRGLRQCAPIPMGAHCRICALDADVEHLAAVAALHEASRNPRERAELTSTFRARHVDWAVDAACVHDAASSSALAQPGGLVLGLKLYFMAILPIHNPKDCREGLGWWPPPREHDDLRLGTGRRGSFCFASIGDPILPLVPDIEGAHNVVVARV